VIHLLCALQVKIIPLVLNKFSLIKQFPNTENIVSIQSRKTHCLSGSEDINLSMNSRLFTAPPFITLIIIERITEFLDFVNASLF
jgi:hypothetical protein